MKRITEEQKDQMARVILIVSAISVLLGFVIRGTIMGTFSLGTWISFLCFILSFGCVHDHGSNRLAALTFWVSFLAMSITILLGNIL